MKATVTTVNGKWQKDVEYDDVQFSKSRVIFYILKGQDKVEVFACSLKNCFIEFEN